MEGYRSQALSHTDNGEDIEVTSKQRAYGEYERERGRERERERERESALMLIP